MNNTNLSLRCSACNTILGEKDIIYLDRLNMWNNLCKICISYVQDCFEVEADDSKGNEDENN